MRPTTAEQHYTPSGARYTATAGGGKRDWADNFDVEWSEAEARLNISKKVKFEVGPEVHSGPRSNVRVGAGPVKRGQNVIFF